MSSPPAPESTTCTKLRTQCMNMHPSFTINSTLVQGTAYPDKPQTMYAESPMKTYDTHYTFQTSEVSGVKSVDDPMHCNLKICDTIHTSPVTRISNYRQHRENDVLLVCMDCNVSHTWSSIYALNFITILCYNRGLSSPTHIQTIRSYAIAVSAHETHNIPEGEICGHAGPSHESKKKTF